MKVTSAVSIIVVIAAILILGLLGITYGADYSDTIELSAQSKDVQSLDLDKAEEIFRSVGEFELLEKTSENAFKATYLELSDEQIDQIRTKFKENEGFKSMSVTYESKINPGLRASISFLLLSIGVLCVGNYLLLPNITKSRDKVGVAVSTLFAFFFVSLVLAASLSVISQVLPIGKELLQFVILLVMLTLVILEIRIIRVNRYFEAISKKDFGKPGREDILLTLTSLVPIIAFIALSREPLYLTSLALIFLMANFYMQVYTFMDILKVWGYLLNNLPFIKQLKWVRK